jgi:hypothetical protein
MPTRKQPREDAPSHYIATADIPAPYSTESGRMPEFAYRAGDLVPAHLIGSQVPADKVRDPRKQDSDQEEPDTGPGEET